MALIQVKIDFGLINDLQWRSKLRHRRKWCEENCGGYYTHRLISLYCFWEFEIETDAMAFKLRWS